MAEPSTIARPYAQALFSVVKDTDLAKASQVVSDLAQIIQHTEIVSVVANPRISVAQLVDVLLATLNTPSDQSIKNFLQILAENRRLHVLPEISTQLIDLKNKYQGSAAALITSAFALSDAQLADLIAALEKKFGRKLLPTVVVDPSLIGGIKVQVGDEVLDTSVQTRLQRMENALVA